MAKRKRNINRAGEENMTRAKTNVNASFAQWVSFANVMAQIQRCPSQSPAFGSIFLVH